MTDTPDRLEDQPQDMPLDDEVLQDDSILDEHGNPDPDPASGPTAQGLNPDQGVDVKDGVDEPNADFEEETITVQCMVMNVGFEANGVPGVPGDKLAYANGHWFVIRKPAEEQDEEQIEE